MIFIEFFINWLTLVVFFLLLFSLGQSYLQIGKLRSGEAYDFRPFVVLVLSITYLLALWMTV